jgi:hypothetical protein
MTIVKGFLQMSGSIKGVSFYTLKGSDKVIMRTKGGPKKNQIETSSKFEGLRKSNKEFGGCAKFASKSRHAFGGLHSLADYNLNPVLTGIGKNLMKLDKTGEVGKRSLKLSVFKEALEGFNFNRNYPFTTILRVSPRWEIDREQLGAVVTIPRINTDIDLLNFQKLPFFRLIVVIGTISDMMLNPVKENYEPMVPELHGVSQTLTGEWNTTKTILPEHNMTVQLPESRIPFLTDNVTVVLSMAVEFGNVGFTGEPVEVKYAGCGKVLATR